MSTTIQSVVTIESKARTRKLGALLLVIAVVQYWIFEAVSAAAWVDPPYSYFVNYISDLGASANVVSDGRHVNSPLHLLTAFSFGALGIFVAVGCLLIARTVARSGRQRTLLIVGVVFGVGSLVVATVPENTIFQIHLFGALLNFWGGFAVVIIAGTSAKALGLSRPVAITLVALGLFGFVVNLGLFLIPALSTGLIERVSGYSYLVGMGILGITMLTRRKALAAAG